ncbi:hypothetical protein [Geoanaerobacter pelophilus]|nr:hypothetical protein [Geoanaerobacter pelophilus]
MTHIETSRVNEMIGINIGKVQQAAQRLNTTMELEELESQISELEKTTSELKESLMALPYRRVLA